MWWIIIGAIIALVVMIVLLMMFTGSTKDVQTGLLDCTSKGGECKSEYYPQCPDGYDKAAVFKCENTGEVCCFKNK